MSMPLRFADSENPAMTLPDVGHIQPMLSSISGTRAASGRAGSAEEAALEGAGAGAARTSAGAARGSAAASAGAESLSCAKACSEYGTLTALGSVLKVAVFGRPLGDGDGDGAARASPPLGVTGAGVASGEVTAPPSAAPGGPSASTCPTRITFTFSMLFQAASSR